jgi:hypothetical protein
MQAFNLQELRIIHHQGTMKKITLIISLFLFMKAAAPLNAQISAFTYQGRLDLNGTPANGYYDFMFRLMNDPIEGAAAPVIPINPAVLVTNGLFTTGMDFGAENLNGANRWLEISVRTNGGGPFITLAPRQLLTPTPYAVAANAASNLLGTLPASQISGTVPNASLPASPSFSGTVTANNFSGNGANLTNVNATTLSGLNSSNLWRTSGNAGTAAGTHFIGTTDNQPLELKVNGMRALRIEPKTDGAPNMLGGSPANAIIAGARGATIAGGGAENDGNFIGSGFSTIGGGIGNVVQENTSVATIGGGSHNAIQSFAGSGTIGGGSDNTITGFGYSATIGGGDSNSVEAGGGTVAGGSGNRIRSGAGSGTIAGGFSNRIREGAHDATIGGGYLNDIQTNAQYTVVSGGNANTISSYANESSIAGGGNNFVGDDARGVTIGGGSGNTVEAVAGWSTIGGGTGNSVGANTRFATISGGAGNEIGTSAQYATIPGGQGNTAIGQRSFAAGSGAHANHLGAFVWCDGDGGSIASTNANSVTMRAVGGYRLFTDFTAATGAFLAAGSGSWISMSDRNAKENFRAADASEVLEKVVALPLQTWNYKSQGASIRHIGPMAQDFKAAFGLGESDTGISNVDADGVAFAAIQGLNQKLEDTRAENMELKLRLKELESAVQKLLAQTPQP